MSTELTIKKGRGVPKDAEMAEAELALDLDDGTLYSKLGDGLVHALNEAPDADNYGHWKLQVDYGTPYQVVSGATANFEGTNGIKVTRTGDTVTIDGSELDLDEDADNYQYWTYKINGFSTTNVLSTQLLDFQSGDGIDITKEGYGIKISATGGGGGGGEFVHIGDTPPSSPEEGQQWMEVPASGEATMWIYDGAKWLQHPSGKDGADGVDGVDGLWTDNGGSISYNGPISAEAATFSGTARFETLDNPLMLRNGEDVYSIGVSVTGISTGQAACIAHNSYHTHLFKQEASGEHPTIECEGNATFSGTVNAGGTINAGNGAFNRPSYGGIQFTQGDANGPLYILPRSTTGFSNGVTNLGSNSNRFASCYLTGSVVSTRHGVSIGTRDLIETLSTLRNATKDETTIKGLRDAIGNAVGGLIEKFEAMEAVTQEISDE